MKVLKKIIVFLIVFLISSSVGCGNSAPETGSFVIESVSSNASSIKTESQELSCVHEFEVTVLSEPLPLKDGEQKKVCTKCSETVTEPIPATKTLKVLAVGNSFSVDGMEYLWDIATDAGCENVILGNLYIGGCSIDMHWDNIKSDAAKYTYYKNTEGKWTESKNTPISVAIADEEWDFVTLQQVSAKSGLPDSYGNAENVINHIASELPKAKFFWQMTWAYQHDAYTSNFKAYDRDQLKMYNAIVSTFKQKVQPNENIDGVIPAGTAIQNLRTTRIGDTLTRDGHHLSYSYGRFTASFAWYAALTGGSVEQVDWYPQKYPEIGDDLAIIRQSVKDAIANPLSITQQAK